MPTKPKTRPKTAKAFRPRAVIAVVIALLLVTFLYFPLYNQPGVHTAAGFLPETEPGVYSAGGVTLAVSDGTVSFPGGLSPLSAAPMEQAGYYTVTRDGDVLYSGPIPASEAEDRAIAADGTLSPLTDGTLPAGGYPVSLSQLIPLSQGTPETRGRGGLTAGFAALLIWAVDLLFPNFFFRADPRNAGSRSAPAAGYRRVQRALWLILPLVSACFLLAALL